MDVVQQGSLSPHVKLLQRLLNKRHVATPSLKEDGAFGPKTKTAVTTFQGQQHLKPDGVVGSQTWQRLGIRHDITHPVRLFPQPTGMTCWSASATMILGNVSVGPGQATLSSSGGLAPSPANIEVFARGLGWRVHYPQSWTVSGLASLIQRKPAWAVGGGSGWLHAIVLSGLWSDGAEDGSGTLLRIHDPWPPGVGAVYTRFYRGTVDGFDFISMYVLQP
jgi:hypothetical protein